MLVTVCGVFDNWISRVKRVFCERSAPGIMTCCSVMSCWSCGRCARQLSWFLNSFRSSECTRSMTVWCKLSDCKDTRWRHGRNMTSRRKCLVNLLGDIPSIVREILWRRKLLHHRSWPSRWNRWAPATISKFHHWSLLLLAECNSRCLPWGCSRCRPACVRRTCGDAAPSGGHGDATPAISASDPKLLQNEKESITLHVHLEKVLDSSD